MNKKNIFYSFVLPAYKIEFLPQAIDSILGQTYDNFELIIVNDKSPDKIYNLVETYKNPKISYYENKENIGGKNLIEQWNKSLSYAKGDYIIMASDDDVYEKDFLHEINILQKKYPNCSVLRGRTQAINENNTILYTDIAAPEFVDYANFLLLENHLISCISNYVFKNDNFLFLNFPLAWWSDRFTVIKYSKNGVAITNKIVHSFRHSTIHISANTNTKTIYKKIQASKIAFDWLENELSDMKTSESPIEKTAYKNFFESNHFYFMHIAKLLFKLKFYDILPMLIRIKKENFITQREFFKLFYFYFQKRL